MSSGRLAAIAFAVFFLFPTTASADVEVAGTGEPAFTKSTQNTQWVSWDSPSGSDAYRLHITYIKDSVQVSQFTLDAELSGGPMWINWADIAAVEHGHSYAICVQGRYSLPNDPLFFPDGSDSCANGTNAGKRTSTTIDLSKPTVSVELAAGAATILGPSVPLEITYEDNLAPPFPANFLCQQTGTGASACDGQVFGFSDSCSVPAESSKSTTFSCTLDTTAVDTDTGEFVACIRAADSAMPDNPNGPDQVRGAGEANLSDPACDSVDLLDAECEAAKSRAAKAKAKLAKLKQRDASGEKIRKARKAAKKAKRAAAKACA